MSYDTVIIGVAIRVIIVNSYKTLLNHKWENVSNTSILGDTAGVDNQAGWNAFVITSLKSGSNISIIFPLLNASYAPNLKKKNKFGLSGGAILAVKNDNLSQGKFSVATKNVTRFEYTFTLDNSDKVVDFLNISAIPQGCGGHLNCNATNFNASNKYKLWYSMHRCTLFI